MARTLSAFAADETAGQDIRLDARGNLAIATGTEDVRQRVVERLRFSLGEWYLSVHDGVPYRSEIFNRSTTVGLAQAIVTEQIERVDGVATVSGVQAAIDPATRRMTYSAVVTTDDGAALAMDETIG